MKYKSAMLALLAIVFVFALSAQDASGVIGWYNGDWQSGIPSVPNYYVSPDDYSRVYDQFQVPNGGWTIVSVFSDNLLHKFPTVGNISWEIRRGMAPGHGGDVVASGISAGFQLPDPSVTVQRYKKTEVVAQHYRIQVNYLNIQLQPGTYWISVTPVGSGNALASATLGANAVGLDVNGLRMALVDSSKGPHFAIAESLGRTGQVGRARHFSQGVIIAK